MDIGGDERGALALGRYSEDILEENNYEMLFVVNPYRPLTSTPEDAVEVMREIEAVAKIKFTAIVNNSNVGNDTTENDVISCDEYINKLKQLTGLEVVMTTATKTVAEKLQNHYDNVFELTLQEKYFDIRKED
jgi:ribosomal protein L5